MNEQDLSHTVRSAWGEFIESVEWEHFLTLTFSPQRFPRGLSKEHAMKRFRQYANALGGMLFSSVPWFATVEETVEGNPHVHALTQGTGGLDLEAMREKWRKRNGRILRIDPYEKGRGGGYYVTQMAGTEEFAWDMSRSLVKSKNADE